MILLAFFAYLQHGNLCQVIWDNLLTGRSEIIADLNMSKSKPARAEALFTVPVADEGWKMN